MDAVAKEPRPANDEVVIVVDFSDMDAPLPLDKASKAEKRSSFDDMTENGFAETETFGADTDAVLLLPSDMFCKRLETANGDDNADGVGLDTMLETGAETN